MKEVPLTNSALVALVDDADFEIVSRFTWFYNRYAYISRPGKHGQKIIYMHHLIIGKLDGYEIDHIDHNKLDNQRSNLRHVTRSQNKANGELCKSNTSGFKGVRRNKGAWAAQIWVNGKFRYLGRFDSKECAAEAYNNAALKHFGSCANLNIIFHENQEQTLSTS